MLLKHLNRAWQTFAPGSDYLHHDKLEARLRAPLSLVEFGGLVAAVVALIWLAQADLGWPPGTDFTTLMRVAHGDLIDFYYAYWLIPPLEVLGHLPYAVAYFIWTLANIAAFFFAMRVFGANRWLALWSYQLLALVFYGQITGLLTGGLALLWWGVSRRTWWMAGLGLTVMLTKYQFGLLGLVAVILGAGLTWRDWLHIGVWPLAVALASIALYGLWPLEVIERLMSHPANTYFSVSLWRWIGPWGVLAFAPLLWLPRRIDVQLIGWFAAGALGLPYFQQIDLVVLMALPLGPLAGVGYLGFAQGVIGSEIVRVSWLIPATILVLLTLTHGRSGSLWRRSARSLPSSAPLPLDGAR